MKYPKNSNKNKKPIHTIYMENKKNNKIIKSALFLTVAGFISKMLGVLYKVPLLKIVGSEGLGYYQLVFPVFAFSLILSSGGITTTLSKIISKCKTHEEKNCYFKICLLESLFFSLLVSLAIYFFSNKISAFQGEEMLNKCYKILVLAIISCAVVASVRGYFQGINNMNYTAWSQIIEQVFKIFLGLFFSYLFIKKSVVNSIYGVFLGLTLSEIISAIFLIMVYKLSIKKTNTYSYNFLLIKQCLKNFNKELVPITLTAIITPLFSAINSLIVVDLLLKAGISQNIAITLFGLSGVVVSLIGIPTIISSALSTTIFPRLCSCDKSESEKNTIISFSYKLIFAVTIPCVFVFVFFSKPIVSLLYSDGLLGGGVNQLEVASTILKIVACSVIYNCLSAFTTMLLQAQNKSFKACVNILYGSLIALMCFIFFVKNPAINILGDSLSALIGIAVTTLLNLTELNKTNKKLLRFKDIFLSPVLSSFLMIVLMKYLYTGLSGIVPAKLLIFFVCAIGLLVYALLIFTLKVFKEQDVSCVKPLKENKNKIFG